VTGAALRMTWPHLFVAGAVFWTHGMEKSQNALAQGRQLCTQLSIFEGSLAELLRFRRCQNRKLRKSRILSVHQIVFVFIYYISSCLSVCLTTIYLSVYLPVHLTIWLSIYLTIYLSVYLPVHLTIWLAIYLTIYMSICLST